MKFYGCKAIDSSGEFYLSVAREMDDLSPDCVGSPYLPPPRGVVEVEVPEIIGEIKREKEAVRLVGNKLYEIEKNQKTKLLRLEYDELIEKRIKMEVEHP